MHADSSRLRTRPPGSAEHSSSASRSDEARQRTESPVSSLSVAYLPSSIAMLTRLSIRDIVLIERLDIAFASGLAVLTGETGAGKSILLDAFALALGARGDVALVRHGADQGQVTAAFDVARDHPARPLIEANGIAAEDELILRR